MKRISGLVILVFLASFGWHTTAVGQAVFTIDLTTNGFAGAWQINRQNSGAAETVLAAPNCTPATHGYFSGECEIAMEPGRYRFDFFGMRVVVAAAKLYFTLDANGEITVEPPNEDVALSGNKLELLVNLVDIKFNLNGYGGLPFIDGMAGAVSKANDGVAIVALPMGTTWKLGFGPSLYAPISTDRFGIVHVDAPFGLYKAKSDASEPDTLVTLDLLPLPVVIAPQAGAKDVPWALENVSKPQLGTGTVLLIPGVSYTLFAGPIGKSVGKFAYLSPCRAGPEQVITKDLNYTFAVTPQCLDQTLP